VSVSSAGTKSRAELGNNWSFQPLAPGTAQEFQPTGVQYEESYHLAFGRCFRHCSPPRVSRSAPQGSAVMPDNAIEKRPQVCDQYGRCWRDRGSRRVIIQDSYDYAPRERYIQRRGYYDGGYYNSGPSSGSCWAGRRGIGFGAGPRW